MVKADSVTMCALLPLMKVDPKTAERIRQSAAVTREREARLNRAERQREEAENAPPEGSGTSET